LVGVGYIRAWHYAARASPTDAEFDPPRQVTEVDMPRRLSSDNRPCRKWSGI